MKRRGFLKLCSAASLSFLARTCLSYASDPQLQTFYVATDGLDDQPGTIEHPFATLQRAQQAARDFRSHNPGVGVTIMVRRGTYYLGTTLVFTHEDSGTQDAPVTYSAYPGEIVTLSGGRKLNCQWQTRKGKSICDLNVGNSGPFAFSQLFVNGKRKTRARFPDVDTASFPGNGYITAVRALPSGTSGPDPVNESAPVAERGVVGIEFDPATFSQKRWGKPEEAVIHIFQQNDLGMLAWRIRSIDYDRNRIWFGDGGDQLGSRWDGSPSVIGKGSRFYVDNVLEEMSKPGEWYLSTESDNLYFRAEDDLDLERAVFEVPVLEEIVRIQGTSDHPVEHLAFDGFRLTHSEATYMKPYETAPSGNWALYRGGALVFEQTRNCSVKNCWFDAVGGNAIFWSNLNTAGSVCGCKFTECGDSAICFAGVGGAQTSSLSPSDCAAVNNLIRNCGVFGKQIAGIYLSRSQRIKVANNHIHTLPCSGICIGDAGLGGHTIEHNYIHDTVDETKHYGSLTAFGDSDSGISVPLPELAKKAIPDVADIETIVIRNNLIREKSGYCFVLASGATNYEIHENVAVGTTIRISEGAHRNVYNNILYSCEPAADFLIGDRWADDRYHHNIAVVTGEITYLLSTVADQCPLNEQIDYNCISQRSGNFAATITSSRNERGFGHTAGITLADWQHLGFDRHSSFADPRLADPSRLDFRLLDGSPALTLGFKNFATNQWGPTEDFVSKWPET